MNTDTLTPQQKLDYAEAWRVLKLAEDLWEQRRKARGQEVLRDAQSLMFKMPREFTDADFEQQYERLYNQLYRGYA
tara:strand:- start:69 stop:296 length:228 start_codon:yes stop_codon:yes gene_type:complete